MRSVFGLSWDCRAVDERARSQSIRQTPVEMITITFTVMVLVPILQDFLTKQGMDISLLLF